MADIKVVTHWKVLSKVAFESNLRKKLARTEHVLIMKVSFERRKMAKVFMTHVQDFFRKSLSKATFERKLSGVSLPLQQTDFAGHSNRNYYMLIEVSFYAPLDTKQVILETFFVASLLA